MSNPALVATKLCKQFVTGERGIRVLSDVSIKLYPGALSLIMGPSGSGKSTLLAAISGLLRPDGGQVLASGVDIWALKESARDRFRLKNCGFIFQGFNLFSSLTALQQVQVVLEYAGVRGKEAGWRASAALDEVGLAERSHLRPIELSGGEKQRVAIARALAKRPQFLFADEPTSALDSENGQVIVQLLQRAAKVHGAVVFCVTHDPRLVSHADRVIRIEDGQIKSDEQGQKLSVVGLAA